MTEPTDLNLLIQRMEERLDQLKEMGRMIKAQQEEVEGMLYMLRTMREKKQ